MPRLTVDEVARLTGGSVRGDGAKTITGAAPPHVAGPDDLTFVFHEKALAAFVAGRAGAAIVGADVVAPGRNVVQVRNPPAAMAVTLAALHPEERPAPGVHASAVVHESARLGARVHVGAYAVVEHGATLADDVIVGAGCHVGARCAVGERTRLFPHVVLYADVTLGRGCVLHSGVVVGADGFGFVRAGGRHVKIPQIAGVVVGDDVEIGAGTCIDRGTLTPTRIGTNTKIDNLCQVGHNCELGERVIVCGQVALAGSTIVEDDVVLAGQAGASGHLTIAKGTIAAARTGITSNTEPGSKIAGYPHMPVDVWRRSSAVARSLPEMRSAMRRLEQRVAELERGGGAAATRPD